MISTSVHSNLDEFNAAFRQYLDETRKEPGKALEKQGRELAWGLYNLFKAISPRASSIYSDALSRKFRHGRHGNNLAPAISGISRAAWRRADALLDGARSQLFKLEPGFGPVPRLRRLRFSGRPGRRRRKLRALVGGRFGNRFAASALRPDQVNPDELADFRKANPHVKRLNRRAIAAHAELVLRSRAAAGGTMAVQWLPKVWKKRSSSVAKGGPLVVRSTQGIPLGQVNMVQDGSGSVAAVELTGMVPGTVKQNARWNIVNRALSARAADMRQYLAARAAKRRGGKAAAA